MFKKLRQLICRITGHWFTHIDTWIFLLKTNEINRDMTATIKCRVCQDVFVHKDSLLANGNSRRLTPDERGILNDFFWSHFDKENV